MERRAPSKPRLLYDGDCRFCAYWVRYWQRLTGSKVEYRPYQEVLSEYPDLTAQECRRAVQLILQSSSSALESETQRGSIFVLDMGNPVRIVDLARRMITLYGLEPEADVPIEFVGLRPGEKLYEELFDICEEQVESGIDGIFEARSRSIPLPFITMAINRIAECANAGEDENIVRLVHGLARYPANGNDQDLLLCSSAAELTMLFERAYLSETANDR